MAEAKTTTRTFDHDQLAKMFGLPDWDRVLELNIDYVDQARSDVRAQELADGASEDEAEDVAENAEREAGDEVYRNWSQAVLAAAEELFGAHHLQLVQVGKRGGLYRVADIDGWPRAARAIARTIDGVGLVSVAPSDLRAPRRFVMGHLGAVRHYPEVYGTASAKRIYERAWR